jgi:hypothetical protein
MLSPINGSVPNINLPGSNVNLLLIIKELYVNPDVCIVHMRLPGMELAKQRIANRLNIIKCFNVSPDKKGKKGLEGVCHGTAKNQGDHINTHGKLSVFQPLVAREAGTYQGAGSKSQLVREGSGLWETLR